MSYLEFFFMVKITLFLPHILAL